MEAETAPVPRREYSSPPYDSLGGSGGVEVSNLHWQVIHTEGRKVKSKARSAHDAMRALNPTVSVTAVTEPPPGTTL